MGSGPLVIGITLLIFALIIAAGFTIEMASDALEPEPPSPFGTDPDPESDSDGDVILDLDREGPRRRRTGLLPDPDESGALDLPHDGVLTQSERATVTEDGYLPYTLQRGESLRDVAERYLGKARLWKVLQEYNPTTLADPRGVRPGTVIRIPLWLREDF